MHSHRRHRCTRLQSSHRSSRVQFGVLGLTLALVAAPLSLARGADTRLTSTKPASVKRPLSPTSFSSALAALHKRVPAYSRQTGLACSSCHYQFPQLTPFGRLFKLNGYTLVGTPTIGQPGDSAGKESLKLPTVPGLAAMVVSSVTQTNKSVPETQNGTAAFPQEMSLFLAGEITPHLGVFSQFTYAAVDGAIGIDNFDMRLSYHRTPSNHDLIYGLTLHNNPTVQDPWNTVPAWGFPFMRSETAPSSIASTMIDGGLAQQVVGLGAYSLFSNTVYGEFTVYRSAPQGVAAPLGSTATDVARNVIPYWRLALQRESPSTSLMLGTFGFDAHLYPTGVSGPTDHFTDAAIDGQAEYRDGAAAWIGRASFIHESQHLDATEDGVKRTLSTARISATYLPQLRYGFTLGYFQTSGTTDATLYPSEAIVGSRTGSPKTSGLIGEATYNPWQNTRVGLQYLAYNRFNGSSSAYDVVGGRNASANNTLYLYLWLAF